MAFFQSRYRRDVKRYRHDQRDRAAVEAVIALLLVGEPLPPKYKEHLLTGDYAGCWECHCLPGVLLIYQRTAKELVLHRLGSHAELF
ncbi:MAG: type II toxin-antitoxin system YafQ family toxin [Verrucomicrobiales bacterium]|nr:type II toxin-antitoxin system YafQ family toxin [Verrucomicrobiales bacterium]